MQNPINKLNVKCVDLYINTLQWKFCSNSHLTNNCYGKPLYLLQSSLFPIQICLGIFLSRNWQVGSTREIKGCIEKKRSKTAQYVKHSFHYSIYMFAIWCSYIVQDIFFFSFRSSCEIGFLQILILIT